MLRQSLKDNRQSAYSPPQQRRDLYKGEKRSAGNRAAPASKLATIDEGPVKLLRQVLQLGMFQTPGEHAERFIERHSRSEQMRQLFREQMMMRVSKRYRESRERLISTSVVNVLWEGARRNPFWLRFRSDSLDPHRHCALPFYLRDRARPIRRTHDAFDQLSRFISGGKPKIRHALLYRNAVSLETFFHGTTQTLATRCGRARINPLRQRTMASVRQENLNGLQNPQSRIERWQSGDECGEENPEARPLCPRENQKRLGHSAIAESSMMGH